MGLPVGAEWYIRRPRQDAATDTGAEADARSDGEVKALVVGGSGATGALVVEGLLDDDAWVAQAG